MPDLFIRGAGTYTAHVNADNPLGTMQSIERTLRTLERVAEDERNRIQRLEKALADYQAQARRPFEHQARLKELLAHQARLNAALDLDKSDAQAVEQEAAPDLDTLPAPRPARSDAPTPERESLPAPQL